MTNGKKEEKTSSSSSSSSSSLESSLPLPSQLFEMVPSRFDKVDQAPKNKIETRKSIINCSPGSCTTCGACCRSDERFESGI